MDTLHNELAAHVRLRDQLLALYPDIDERTLQDTLEGASNLAEVIIEAVRSVEDDESVCAALKERETQLKARRERIAHRVERKRELIAAAMEEASLRRVEAPDFTLSLTRSAPKVIVTDESLIPPQFFVVKDPEYRLDRKAVKEALQTGYLPGCTLSNGGATITVRRG